MIKKIALAAVVFLAMPLASMEGDQPNFADREFGFIDTYTRSFCMGTIVGFAQGGSYQIRKSTHPADIFFDIAIVAIAGTWVPIEHAYRGNYREASNSIVPFYAGLRMGYLTGRLCAASLFSEKNNW